MNTATSTPPYLEKLHRYFDLEAHAADLVGFLPSFFSAVLTLLVYYVLYRVVRRAAELFIRRAALDPTAGEFLQTLVRYTILTIGVVSALGRVGVNTASLLASLGVAGLTVGFAAKDALSNMVAGIFIFWDRPFVLGDLIEVDGQYGRVSQITLRSTRVVTPDGRMLAVPNTTIVNSTVASYTNFPHLRIDVAFTVGVGEDLERVRKVALAACEAFPGLMAEPPASVVVTALNDYNVALELRAWLDDEKAHISARMALRERLFLALRDADVDMPYETLALATPVAQAG